MKGEALSYAGGYVPWTQGPRLRASVNPVGRGLGLETRWGVLGLDTKLGALQAECPAPRVTSRGPLVPKRLEPLRGCSAVLRGSELQSEHESAAHNPAPQWGWGDSGTHDVGSGLDFES